MAIPDFGAELAEKFCAQLAACRQMVVAFILRDGPMRRLAIDPVRPEHIAELNQGALHGERGAARLWRRAAVLFQDLRDAVGPRRWLAGSGRRVVPRRGLLVLPDELSERIARGWSYDRRWRWRGLRRRCDLARLRRSGCGAGVTGAGAGCCCRSAWPKSGAGWRDFCSSSALTVMAAAMPTSSAPAIRFG